MMRLSVAGLSLCLLIGFPLLGVGLAGRPLEPYFDYPPRTHQVAHAPFSWPVFALLALAILLAIAPVLLRIIRCPASRHTGRRPGNTPVRQAFPWWGWAGLVWTLVAWLLAWSRFPWMESLQAWTFTPLWLGYIVVVNAWTIARGGRSALIEQPARFAALLPTSAAFWWLFEYLNRFVHNWVYGGVGELSALEYFVQASIPFSTVLPAVVSTGRLLATVPRLSCGLDRGPSWVVRHPRRWAGASLVLAGLALLGLGLWPDYLFPSVWVAPLVIIVALQVLAGQETILAPLRRGDWRSLWVAALAALVCGFFWELWNWRSLAHWSYAIPYVDRFHLFAMPLLGYAGYLPFGLECLVVANLVLDEPLPVPAERGEAVSRAVVVF